MYVVFTNQRFEFWSNPGIDDPETTRRGATRHVLLYLEEERDRTSIWVRHYSSE